MEKITEVDIPGGFRKWEACSEIADVLINRKNTSIYHLCPWLGTDYLENRHLVGGGEVGNRGKKAAGNT